MITFQYKCSSFDTNNFIQTFSNRTILCPLSIKSIVDFMKPEGILFRLQLLTGETVHF